MFYEEMFSIHIYLRSERKVEFNRGVSDISVSASGLDITSKDGIKVILHFMSIHSNYVHKMVSSIKGGGSNGSSA